MKTKAFTVGLILTVVLSLQVRSNDAQGDAVRIHGKTNHAYGDLLSTMRESFRLRLDEFKGGDSTPSSIIRVNAELYDQERRIQIVGKELAAQEQFLTRAKEIEAIAEHNVDTGTGSRMDYLDAKASRHRAEIELRSAAKTK